MITGMHIRHDWTTFVEWDQKTVRTLCGVTTQKKMAGIPGVTNQPVMLEIGNRYYMGWCVRCCKFAGGEYRMTSLPHLPSMHESISNLHNEFYKIVTDVLFLSGE